MIIDNWNRSQADYWNKIALDYDSLYQNQWSQLENAENVKQIKLLPNLKGTNQILDLGCGTGLGYELCYEAIGNDFNYYGIDISLKMIEICKSKYSKGVFDVQDMTDLSIFESGKFDVVISLFTSMSFSKDVSKTLSEIFRVLRVNGSFLISVLSRYSLRRIITQKLSRIEDFSTRNSHNYQTVPAQAYSTSEISKAINEAGLTIRSINGFGVLSGLLEKDNLWNLDQGLSKTFPSLCHTINVAGQKITE